MSEFYTDFELKSFLDQKKVSGFFYGCALKLATFSYFFIGTSILPFLLMLPWALRDRRIRLLTVAGGLLAAALIGETWFIPHYFAPFTAAFYVILLQSMRHLRLWRPGGQPAGSMLVRAIPVLCLVLLGVRLYAHPLNINLGRWPEMKWYGPPTNGAPRAAVLAELKSYSGAQLVIVKYTPDHDFIDDWVYNAPDLDKSKVVWARDMGAEKNGELLRYFHDRKAWLVEPDFNPPRISPYACDETGATLSSLVDCSGLSTRASSSVKGTLR
jgi:hypothetical protein